MKMINIKGFDKPISSLIQGSDYFRPDIYETVRSVLDRFIAIGGNTIDTAFGYMRGESEVAIGMWLEERNNRKDVIILTKGAHPFPHIPRRVNRECITADLTESLKRLKTDYIDLYALHRDDPDVPVSTIIDVLNEHIDAGRIKAIGVSNWTTERIQEANDYAAMNGKIGFTFNSPNLSLAKAQEPYFPGSISANAEYCSWHEKTQLPLLSWSSQARGFFTGRFTPEDLSNKDLVRAFYTDANWERYHRAEQLAEEKGVSTIKIALAYVLNQPFPTCAVIGPQNEEELLSCYEGSKIILTHEEVEWLEYGESINANI
ncbi:aryl-alcohol dehydrogenase-like predicted oxidoreductase [Neobacillus niacini]|uniref:aldo/keto reductase n=1 Tax=Neobacillus driksii TaxID=3035913 RepID=UPI0027877930|nr:aldo/keto reductase [Neobacillus niacini]MDQ0972215.1 aryl-alcohol dehydrogenase-like predicted oxidoreductase [Neobacillus niacini]